MTALGISSDMPLDQRALSNKDMGAHVDSQKIYEFKFICQAQTMPHTLLLNRSTIKLKGIKIG